MTNGLVVEGTTTFNDEVSFGSAITSNINAGTNTITSGAITSTGTSTFGLIKTDLIQREGDGLSAFSFLDFDMDTGGSAGTNNVVLGGVNNVDFLVDTNNNSITGAFVFGKDANTMSSATQLMTLDESGHLDLKTGNYKVNGTTVITSARNLENIGLISSTRLNSNNGGYTISYSEGTGQYPNIRLQDTSGTNQYGEVMHINGDTKIRSYNGFFTNGSITFAGNSTYGSFNTSGDFTVNSGSIFLNDTGKGIHMLSPNGTEYQLTVDNSGNLVITEI
jgi:hypothetical protein